MFKVGDVVKERGRDRKLEIMAKEGDTLILKILDENLKFITFNENQVELYIENKIKGSKSNKIKRTNTIGDVTEIEWEKKDNKLLLDITGKRIHFNILLKILLHHEEILNHTYERISPYKVSREFQKGISHTWFIEFLNIKNQQLEKNKIIHTDDSMMLKGKFELFLPDMLEICVERGFITRYKDGYRLIYDISGGICDCEYIQPELTIGKLKNDGFIIPKKYIEVNKIKNI